MTRLNLVLTALLVLALGAVIPAIPLQTVSSQQVVRGPNKVLARNAAILAGRAQRRPKEQMVSGGVMAAYLDATAGAAVAQVRRAAAPANLARNTMGCSNEFAGPIPNVRVNQDCSRRRQAEENIAIDPLDSNHLAAGQNDSRIGFNHCGIDFSFNRGKRWGDMIPPFWQVFLTDLHTSDACSDPTGAFDLNGNAYFGGIIFDVNSAANAIVVAKSNAAFGGTFYHSPNSALSFQEYRDTPLGVVVNESDPNIFHDKEFLNVDAQPASAKKGNVYMTWTRFNAATGAGVGADSPINFSQSTDGGFTWSARIEISGANAAICASFSGETNPAACDQDQGSWPEVGPDGTLYVFFNNNNTPTIVAQQLMVKCPATMDCTLPASWVGPFKVADDFGTQPFSAPLNGCPGGRQCLPPNGYRMNDFGVGHADSEGELYFLWSDFRNGGPCASAGGLPVEPCANHNNDVFLVISDDGGVTWSAPINVTPTSVFGTTAQWQAWFAIEPNDALDIAFYDRHYGTCETDGCNDITLAVSRDDGATFTYQRITTSSMPNLTPVNNPLQAGFLGDYMFVAADRQGAVIVWADTRGLDGTVEEDVYFARARGGAK